MAKHFQVDTGGTLTTSLVSYYPMEGNSNDFWGTNNGVDTSMSYSSSYGKVVQGALFNGSNSEIALGTNSSLNITGDLSINVWIKAVDDHSSSGSRVILTKGNWVTDGYSLALQTGTVAAIRGTTSFTVADTGVVGNYVMITLTVSGTTGTIYINGVSQGTGSLTAISSSANAAIGVRGNSGNDYFNGDMDEIGLWSKALSSTEITNLYNSGAGQTMITSVANTGNMLAFF